MHDLTQKNNNIRPQCLGCVREKTANTFLAQRVDGKGNRQNHLFHLVSFGDDHINWDRLFINKNMLGDFLAYAEKTFCFKFMEAYILCRKFNAAALT